MARTPRLLRTAPKNKANLEWQRELISTSRDPKDSCHHRARYSAFPSEKETSQGTGEVVPTWSNLSLLGKLIQAMQELNFSGYCGVLTRSISHQATTTPTLPAHRTTKAPISRLPGLPSTDSVRAQLGPPWTWPGPEAAPSLQGQAVSYYRSTRGTKTQPLHLAEEQPQRATPLLDRLEDQLKTACPTQRTAPTPAPSCGLRHAQVSPTSAPAEPPGASFCLQVWFVGYQPEIVGDNP